MADKKFKLKKLPNGPEIALTVDLSVGRSAESDLKLVEGSPSRKHARLFVTADSVSVQDLGSTNGTFVNDKRITSKVQLSAYDRVRFDVEEFLFEVELPEPPSDLTVRRPLPAASVPPPQARPAASPPAATPPPPPAAPPRVAAPPPAPAAKPAVMPAPEPSAPARAPVPAPAPAAPAAAPAAAAPPAASPPAAAPPQPAAPAPPAAAAPAARASPASADVVADSQRVKVPAGWVDNAPSAGGNKTQFMTPEQMEAERRRAMAGVVAEAAHGRVDTPSLIVPGESEGSTRIQLRAAAAGKKEWSVGSEGEREILIKRVGVSALHAKIVNDGNRWKVIDQLSANGTFVNGKRCNVSYLAAGDRIAFGSVECTFQLPKGGAADLFGARAGTAAGSGSAAPATKLKKVLVIAGIAFVITLVVLFLLLSRFG